MSKTKIEWAHFTVNFWWGCTKVSEACQFCYAENIMSRFGPKLFGSGAWGKGTPRGERLEKAREELLKINRKAKRDGVRYRVFINSMSDWLDDEVPIQYLIALLDAIRLCPDIDLLLLTKRPQNWYGRLCDALVVVEGGDINDKGFFEDRDGSDPETETGLFINDWCGEEYPENVWIGTTIENQARANERIPQLLKIPAGIRFLSCEPLLGAVDLHKAKAIVLSVGWSPSSSDPDNSGGAPEAEPIALIDWVIPGGESGWQARPSSIVWFRLLRDQCRQAGIAFLFKQWGEYGPNWLNDDDGKMIPDSMWMDRLGKKNAGRLLDGVEHNEFPI